MAKYGYGDVVRIRGKELGRVVCEIIDDDGAIWYEIEAVDFDAPFNREIKESDLTTA